MLINVVVYIMVCILICPAFFFPINLLLDFVSGDSLNDPIFRKVTNITYFALEIKKLYYFASSLSEESSFPFICKAVIEISDMCKTSCAKLSPYNYTIFTQFTTFYDRLEVLYIIAIN